jgi:Domain of unknown function (DUF4149)
MWPQRRPPLADQLERPAVPLPARAVDARGRFSIALAALWWGSLTSLMFWVVPLLFTHLSTPFAAGTMAAKLFAAQNWTGIACAMLVLMMSSRKEPEKPDSRAQAAIKFVVAGLLLAVLGEFVIAPRIVAARAEGGNLKLWHLLGSGFHLLQWHCAGVALWRLSGPQNAGLPPVEASNTEAQDEML